MRTRHSVGFALLLLALLAVACFGGDGPSTRRQGPADDGRSEPLVLAPSEVLQLSSERTLEVQSFRGTFTAKFGTGGFSIEMGGDYVFEAPDTMYMTMDVFGQTMELLMVLPDMYVHVPGEGWYSVSAEAAGVDWDALLDYVEQRGPFDYAAITGELEGLTQLPDDTIDGVTYLHYQGQLDISKVLDELPEGIVDPALLDEAADFVNAMAVELWIDPDGYLPYRTDMTMSFTELEEVPNFSMEISMLSYDYNEPVQIPEPPKDANPIELLTG